MGGNVWEAQTLFFAWRLCKHILGISSTYTWAERKKRLVYGVLKVTGERGWNEEQGNIFPHYSIALSITFGLLLIPPKVSHGQLFPNGEMLQATY